MLLTAPRARLGLSCMDLADGHRSEGAFLGSWAQRCSGSDTAAAFQQ